jgi:capsular exopolysaccharide synthesis family protein
METIFSTNEGGEEEAGGILNFNEFKDRVIRSWKWLLLSCSISLAVAFFYLRYSIPVFQSEASILVQTMNQNNKELAFLNELNIPVGPKVNNISNEIEILKSEELLKSVIIKLKLYQQLFLIGNKSGIQRKEIYNESPVDISLYNSDTLIHPSGTLHYYITIIDEKKFEINLANNRKIYQYGEKCPIPFSANYLIVRRSVLYEKKWQGLTLEVTAIPITSYLNKLRSSLFLSVSSDANPSQIFLSLRGSNPSKNQVTLDQLIADYEADGIRERNRIGQNTSLFINERLSLIEQELGKLEVEVEDFKTTNKLMDVQIDASSVVSKSAETEKLISENQIQQSLTNYLLEYLKKTNGFNDVLPSNLGLNELSINRMTDEFNRIISERNQQLQYAREENPNIQRLEAQLTSLRTTIEKSLKNRKSALQIELETFKSNENRFNNRFQNLPRFEREYRNIVRKQQIMEELYLHLLKKREENEMALAATVGSIKVVTMPTFSMTPIFPKKQNTYFLALLIGIFVPIGIIFVSELFNTKVKTTKDISNQRLTVLGEIPFEKENKDILSELSYKTALSESFRMLRANLAYVLPENNGKGRAIAITSTIPKEGKTFTSIKLAVSLASTDKKVVLVGMDLRMPKIPEYLKIDDNLGISNYLIDSQLKADDIIKELDNKSGLFFISAGTIPPNPAELLMKPRLYELLEELKLRFDYIVMDLSPIGFVADSYPVIEYADYVLYLVRANYLDKKMLNVPASIVKGNKNPNLGIILNFSDFDKKGYGYGYGYGYTYGSMNGSAPKAGNKSLLSRLGNFFRFS